MLVCVRGCTGLCLQFMLRLKNPCGKVDPATYKCIDDLSEKYGQQDLRATTRQAFQVPKPLRHIFPHRCRRRHTQMHITYTSRSEGPAVSDAEA